MVKTQVRIPDALFRRAKVVAARKGLSFTEIVRRGLEYMTQTNPPDRKRGATWRLPAPVDMGQPLLPESEWTGASH